MCIYVNKAAKNLKTNLEIPGWERQWELLVQWLLPWQPTPILTTHSHPDIGPYHQLLFRFSLQSTDELLCSRSPVSWWGMSRSPMRRLRTDRVERSLIYTAPDCQLFIYLNHWRESGSSGSGQEEWSPLLPVSCWPQPNPLDETQSKHQRTLKSQLWMVGCGGSGHMAKGFPIFSLFPPTFEMKHKL